MTNHNAKLFELIDRLESTLAELREHLSRSPPSASEAAVADPEARAQAIEAFADETFRARDA